MYYIGVCEADYNVSHCEVCKTQYNRTFQNCKQRTVIKESEEINMIVTIYCTCKHFLQLIYNCIFSLYLHCNN